MTGKQYVWIDTVSGTWGSTTLSQGALVLLDADFATATSDLLESASDSEIADIGLEHGAPAVPAQRCIYCTKYLDVSHNSIEGDDIPSRCEHSRDGHHWPEG